MKRTLVSIAFPLLASSLGCTVHTAGAKGVDDAFRTTVAQRATFDMSCAEVAVQNIGGDSYGATGCGQKVSYTCTCTNQVAGSCMEPVCTRDGGGGP